MGGNGGTPAPAVMPMLFPALSGSPPVKSLLEHPLASQFAQNPVLSKHSLPIIHFSNFQALAAAAWLSNSLGPVPAAAQLFLAEQLHQQHQQMAAAAAAFGAQQQQQMLNSSVAD